MVQYLVQVIIVAMASHENKGPSVHAERQILDTSQLRLNLDWHQTKFRELICTYYYVHTTRRAARYRRGNDGLAVCQMEHQLYIYFINGLNLDDYNSNKNIRSSSR